MHTKTLLGVTLVSLVLVGAACSPQASTEQPSEPSAVTNTPTNTNVPPAAPAKPSAVVPAPKPVAAAATIDMNNGGFSPASITVNRGGKVTFVNRGGKSMWPASDPHPTHTAYSGFDPRHGIAPTESWSFTFTKAGTWYYHDHLSPLLTGTIIVK